MHFFGYCSLLNNEFSIAVRKKHDTYQALNIEFCKFVPEFLR